MRNARSEIGRSVAQQRHPAAPEASRRDPLDGHADERLLALRAPARQPWLLAADVGLVDLHRVVKALASRAHEHRAQPVQHRPRGLVGADLQRPLQAQRRDPVLLGREQPARREPNRQRRAGYDRRLCPPSATCAHRSRRTPTARRPAASRRCAHSPGTRTHPASAATPGSPSSRHPYRTRPRTRRSTADRGHRRGVLRPPRHFTPVRWIPRTSLIEHESRGLCLVYYTRVYGLVLRPTGRGKGPEPWLERSRDAGRRTHEFRV